MNGVGRGVDITFPACLPDAGLRAVLLGRGYMQHLSDISFPPMWLSAAQVMEQEWYPSSQRDREDRRPHLWGNEGRVVESGEK